MIVYGIIPARGGSVRIPHKNIVPLRGKPLIEYTIRAAQDSKCLDRIIVSTDCRQTANIAAALGVQVVMRPEALSDGAGHYEAQIAKQCIESLPRPDAICWLQPTSPLRLASWIEAAVQQMERTGCDSVIGYTDLEECQPKYLATIDQNGWVSRFIPTANIGRVHTRTGDVYLTQTDLMLNGDMYGRQMQGLVIPEEMYCNINKPHHLKIAEALL